MADKHDEYATAVHQDDNRTMSAGQYLATRLPTLKPAHDKVPNPFKALALLNFQQWMFFLVGFLGWYVRAVPWAAQLQLRSFKDLGRVRLLYRFVGLLPCMREIRRY
jgi:hypothetical protein